MHLPTIILNTLGTAPLVAAGPMKLVARADRVNCGDLGDENYNRCLGATADGRLVWVERS